MRSQKIILLACVVFSFSAGYTQANPYQKHLPNEHNGFVKISGIPRIEVEKMCDELITLNDMARASGASTRSSAEIMTSCLTEHQNSYNRLKQIWSSLSENVQMECIAAFDRDSSPPRGMGPIVFGIGYTGMLNCVNQAADREKGNQDADRVKQNNKFRY